MDKLIQDIMDIYDGDARAVALKNLIDDNAALTAENNRLLKRSKTTKQVVPMLVGVIVMPVVSLLTLLIGTSLLATSVTLGITSLTALQILVKITKDGD